MASGSRAGLRRTHALFYVFGLLLGLAVHPLAEAVEALLLKRWPLGDESQLVELYQAGSPAWRVGLVAGVVFAGPLVEEFLFRGAIFRGMSRIYPPGFVTIVTACIFGAVHMRWQVIVPVGMVGLVLGWLRAKSGSIVPTALAHMAFNGVSVAAIAVAPEAKYSLAVTLGELALAALLLGCVTLVGARSAVAARARELDLA